MSLVRNVLDKKGCDVVCVDLKTTVQEAAERMHAKHIGAVIVMNGGEVAGIFTERDLLNRVVALRKDPAKVAISEVMTARVAVCSADTSLEACRSAMTKNKMRHLPVVDGGKLVGIISSGDILARELAEQEETIRYLHEYMQGPN
jgi:CBS domain-containing protein